MHVYDVQVRVQVHVQAQVRAFVLLKPKLQNNTCARVRRSMSRS